LHTQHSSDEESDYQDDEKRHSGTLKKSHSTNGAAFAEVVRATMKANEDAVAAAADADNAQ
jgi:hypothetical protein